MRKRNPLTSEQKDFLRDQPQRMIRIDEVCALLGESRSSFYRRHPLAKKVIKNGRSSHWSMQTIRDWIFQEQHAKAQQQRCITLDSVNGDGVMDGQWDERPLLKALHPYPQWVVWKVAKDRYGDPVVEYYCAFDPQRPAKPSDSTTWSDFQTAWTCVESNPEFKTIDLFEEKGGIAFALTMNDPFVCISKFNDLNNKTRGESIPLSKFAGTFCEPSFFKRDGFYSRYWCTVDDKQAFRFGAQSDEAGIEVSINNCFVFVNQTNDNYGYPTQLQNLHKHVKNLVTLISSQNKGIQSSLVTLPFQLQSIFDFRIQIEHVIPDLIQSDR